LCVEKLANEFKSEVLRNTDVFLNTSDIVEISPIKKWLGNEFNYRFQSGNNLGGRMQNAFDDIFKIGYKQTVIVGTDIPDLNSEIVINAFALLEKYDSVIGPSTDGGYYLLGIKQNHPELFEGINWSTDQVFGKTMQRLNDLKLSSYLLKKLIDIDTADDLIEWIKTKEEFSEEPLVKFTKKYLAHGLKSTL
jgi:uncharacterized protein